MSEQLLDVLKLSLLALLYLFLFRVVRAVWAEITPPVPDAARAGRGAPARQASPAVQPAAPHAATGAAAAAPSTSRRQRRAAGKASAPLGTQLVAIEPASQAGRSWPLSDEATIGRGAGCAITVDDDFASQIHARVFRAEGRVHVEDLGSTNGTLLGDHRVGGPRLMAVGDRLKIGSTVLELR